jgi:hypothetical protein
MTHLGILHTSYGQMKGQESTTPTWKNIKLQHGNATKVQSKRNVI